MKPKKLTEIQRSTLEKIAVGGCYEDRRWSKRHPCDREGKELCKIQTIRALLDANLIGGDYRSSMTHWELRATERGRKLLGFHEEPE